MKKKIPEKYTIKKEYKEAWIAGWNAAWKEVDRQMKLIGQGKENEI